MEMLKRPVSGCITIIIATFTMLVANSAQAERFELGASAKEADAVIGCLYPMTGRSARSGKARRWWQPVSRRDRRTSTGSAG